MRRGTRPARPGLAPPRRSRPAPPVSPRPAAGFRMSSGSFSPGAAVRGVRIDVLAGMGGREVVRVGLLGRSGAGTCPNLLQRRSGPGSAARRSAEYQRFSSGVSARSGPLQQIWTNGAVAGPCADGGPGDRPGARADPPRPGRRDVHFALERALLTAHLESGMHISTCAGPTRPHRPGRPPPAPPSRTGPGPRTHDSRREGSIRLRGSCVQDRGRG